MANPYIPEAERVKNAELLDHVRQLALIPLAEMFSEVVDSLVPSLMELAGQSGPSPMGYVDASHEVRRKREQVLARFRAHLANAWQALEAGHPLSVEYKLAQSGGAYSLISHQDLETRLAVRRLADTLAYEWRPELMRLNTYMGLIAGGVRLNEDTLPFGPHHIGAAIHEAFAPCKLTHNARVAIVEACEAQWLTRVGLLYATLEHELVKVSRSSQVARLQPRKRSHIPTARTRSAPGGSEAGESPDWIARFFSRWEESPPAPADAQDLHVRSGKEVLPKSLHQLLQRARAEAGAQPDAAPAGKRPLSQRELLSVLSLMQSMPGESMSDAPALMRRLEQRLKWEVLAGAARLGIDPSSVRLEAADEDAIDLVGMLFDVLLEECQLRGHIREMILRLPVAYLKVALLDRDIFMRSNHPARRLLNLLAEASEHCSGSEAPEMTLLGQVEEAVARLTRDFSENLEIFEAVEQSFGPQYAQYRRRIEIAERRATEMHRAHERRLDARRLAEAELAARLRHREVPSTLKSFLEDYWAPYVGMVALRGEGGAADMAAALALADGLLDELDLARTHGAGKPWLQALRPALTRMFSVLGLAVEVSAAVVDTLQQALQALADDAVRLPELPQVESIPQLEAEPEPQAWVESEVEPEVDEVTADYFRQLPLGTWLDFVNRDGSIQSGKLSWVSPISARLMFVNRRGSRFCVASASELAAMAQMERLRLHRDEDAFYSAMQGAIDRLEG
jgi:hypothetical protein